jgi:hypothetical protein
MPRRAKIYLFWVYFRKVGNWHLSQKASEGYSVTFSGQKWPAGLALAAPESMGLTNYILVFHGIFS